MKINKPHLLLVLVSFSLVVSGCDNIKKMQPETVEATDSQFEALGEKS